MVINKISRWKKSHVENFLFAPCFVNAKLVDLYYVLVIDNDDVFLFGNNRSYHFFVLFNVCSVTVIHDDVAQPDVFAAGRGVTTNQDNREAQPFCHKPFLNSKNHANMLIFIGFITTTKNKFIYR